jgi:hypothetical protein
MASMKEAEQAARIVGDAGGKIVGKTRLQKTAYLLEVCGVGEGFNFNYRHFGPYSEELAAASNIAVVFGMMDEDERQANWGGAYSIYSASVGRGSHDAVREKIAGECAKVDAVELELAATALFLSKEGVERPWDETAARKPEKAAGRLEQSKAFYRQLRAAVPDVNLPDL